MMDMSDVTRILEQIEHGEPQATAQLLPLVYDELRAIAARYMADEAPGHSLQATALVHEAYLRLIGPNDLGNWQTRGHFFAAAAEAMRRILIDDARRKKLPKHGGGRRRLVLDEAHRILESSHDLLVLDDALERLAAEDATAAQIVKLRLFAGLSVEEAADALGLSRATAYRHWTFARAWLRCELGEEDPPSDFPNT
jgi:RNA polymerase sigma factor (TIGR02999 family)